jgi:hypothetical protein
MTDAPGDRLDSLPKRQMKTEVTVMLDTTHDDIESIRRLWPRFEDLVGVRGRKMYAMVDLSSETYSTCTPVRPSDEPAALGLETGVLPGGWYLTARLVGEPPELYDRIAPGMQALTAVATPDASRPLVEYYARHREIELWVPVPVEP